MKFGDSEPFIYKKGEGSKFLVPKEKYSIANLYLNPRNCNGPFEPLLKFQ